MVLVTEGINLAGRVNFGETFSLVWHGCQIFLHIQKK